MKLPAELNDLTLDYLYNDRSALAQCSLVCKDWVTSARYHLWHTTQVYLTSSKIDSKLHRLIALPHITFHIQHVVITSRSLSGGPRTETDIHLLHRVLSLLSEYPQIRSLTLKNIAFGTNTCSGPGCSALRLPSIRQLILQDVAFEALHDVQWLWCVCPQADRFQLDKVWWRPWVDGGMDWRVAGETPRLSYKELALGHCFSRDSVAKWLLGMSPSLNVQTLRLPLVSVHDSFLVDLLRGIGVSLEHLEIGSLGHVKNSTQYTSFFDFSANTELKSISIGLPMYRDSLTVLSWITTILSQIVSTTVTQITFSILPIHISQNAPGLLAAFDWPTLVSVLERPQFVKLSNIVFRLSGQAEYAKYPHNFTPLGPLLTEMVMGHFDSLRCKGVKVSIA
ncbi:hypothetical protein EIP91_003617 [Steccherinum ochraceum]|uniref:F-box domain-containing protein n=1 Tax=Steccherinum ochraceum TaxID=92696 RepID=A0A4R0RGJ9_9APHY|nr:hypothetical protein EIP91_003617 [Steccherinum ochraceum]